MSALGALFAAVLVTAVAAPAARTAPAAALPVRPARVLARYVRALAEQPQPKLLSFLYQVEQLGLRNMTQTHRVYRAGRKERDETLTVDGYELDRPAIRIFGDRRSRYDVAAIAPTPAGYKFAFKYAFRGPGGYSFVFSTEPRAPSSFAVSEITIDGRSFLPSVVRFNLAGNGAHGFGELVYGRSDAYWLVREARVAARLGDGSRALTTSTRATSSTQ